MHFFEVVENRRSIRQFTTEPVPPEVIQKALDAALLAPNSSNTQTWNFFWIRSTEAKKKVTEICLSQAAARTAQELVVITADPALWKRSQPFLVRYVNEIKAHKSVIAYYEKLIPFVYRWGFLNLMAPVKWLLSMITGLFRPMMRGPFSRRDAQEVAIKSAALAAENFVLALTAQGFSSCMMEGFDECRLKRFLKLKSSERAVMVIAVGKAHPEKGTWGPRFRIPRNLVIKEI